MDGSPKEELTWFKVAFVFDIFTILGNLMSTYMNLFLLHLIRKFSEHREHHNRKIFDNQIGKPVSLIVYIRN